MRALTRTIFLATRLPGLWQLELKLTIKPWCMRFYFQLIKSGCIVLLIAALGLACNKQKFLDKKPTTTLLVPTTLSDFQALLDNVKVFAVVPALGEASADNFYVSYTTWQTMTPREYNAYVWARDIFSGQGGQLDWNVPYQQVFYANVVLDGLKGMKVNVEDGR